VPRERTRSLRGAVVVVIGIGVIGLVNGPRQRHPLPPGERLWAKLALPVFFHTIFFSYNLHKSLC